MKRTFAVLATALLSITTLAASPAQAAPVELAGVELSTGAVVLDGDAGCGNRVMVTVRLYDPPSDDVTPDVSADVALAADNELADFLLPRLVRRVGNWAAYTDWVFLCGWETPGRYRVRTEVTWWSDADGASRLVTHDSYFYLQRPTALGYDVAPEGARRGSYLTHSGRLLVDPFGYGNAYGPSGVRLAVSFRRNGTTDYAVMGYVTTKAGGWYSGRIRAWHDGVWRVTYPASPWRQGQTRFDGINLR
jgi:hypothetical protein